MSLIYSTGANGKGQLGLGDNTDRNEFTQVETTTWSFITSGWLHSLAIKSDGTLWSTGDNYYGQLGLNTFFTENENEFTLVTAVSTCSAVAGGYYHSLAVGTNGTLWATGVNGDGQLGLGVSGNKIVFTQVGSLTTWSSVACGRWHSMAIKTDGTLWATGDNLYGQLGLGDNTDRNEFTKVGIETTWSSVACIDTHTMAVKTDGTLWATGENGSGRLGTGDEISKNEFTQIGSGTTWTTISCGITNTMAIKTDGTLWATGAGPSGQLGLSGITEVHNFTQVGELTTWITVSCGHDYTIAIKSDDTLWSTGDNYYGQLGLADNSDRTVFTQVGTQTAVSVAYNGGNQAHILFTPLPGRHIGVMGINGGVLFNEKTIIGDEHGKLFALNMNTYTDNGEEITRTRRTQIINKERLHIIYNKIEINFQTGVGLDVAEGITGEDPEIFLKWSDDGCNTWSTDIATSLGKYQEYLIRAIWRRLGKSRNRVFELTITSPVKFVILGAFSDIKACKS